MIDKRELRIGNWVKFGTYDIQVQSLGTVKMRFEVVDPNVMNTLPYSELDPIPLTPEILEEYFGEKDHIDIGYYQYICFDKDAVIYLLLEQGEGACEVLKLTHIKHLHQLQNLYYALTQTELTKKA